MTTFMRAAFAATAIIALLWSVAGRAQTAPAPTFRLCTGAESGNYFFAGNMLAKNAGTSAKIDVISTTGSIANLEAMMAGRCDGAFVQNDALRIYSIRNPRVIPAIERAAALYAEALHLVCNRSAKIKTLADVKPSHRIAIEDGSGTTTTWENLASGAKDTLGKIPTDPKGGLIALNAAADGADVTCALKVSALNSPMFTQDARAIADKIVMVSIDDDELLKQTDAKGKTIYTSTVIPSDTYRALMPSGFFWIEAGHDVERRCRVGDFN